MTCVTITRHRAAETAGKTISVPDAIHLATAILYRASEFQTFDGGGTGKSLGLLRLSEKVAGHRLVICKPQSRNPQLDLRRPSHNPRLTPRNPTSAILPEADISRVCRHVSNVPQPDLSIATTDR